MVLTFEELPARVGSSLGASSWFTIDQARIDGFASVTDDHQWIHVDVDRASRTPIGSTIAHGFLTLALVAPVLRQLVTIKDVSYGVNYGLNRVRFITPVTAGSRIRGSMTLFQCDQLESGVQLIIDTTMELEGSERPASVAQVLARYYYDATRQEAPAASSSTGSDDVPGSGTGRERQTER